MYCPRCSQQQFFQEVRFCSRCGFQLSVVAELLSNNGTLAERDSRRFNPTRKNYRLGGKAIFSSIVLLPVAIALVILTRTPFPLFLPITVFMFGVAWISYHRIFRDEMLPGKEDRQFFQSVPMPELPPKRVNTAEMKRPPSITEHTTRILEK